MGIRELEKTLKVLGNRRRLAILKLLKRKKEATVGEIASAIKLSFRATSQHLRILANLDLVEREQRGLEAYYCLSKVHSTATRSILSLL